MMLYCNCSSMLIYVIMIYSPILISCYCVWYSELLHYSFFYLVQWINVASLCPPVMIFVFCIVSLIVYDTRSCIHFKILKHVLNSKILVFCSIPLQLIFGALGAYLQKCLLGSHCFLGKTWCISWISWLICSELLLVNPFQGLVYRNLVCSFLTSIGEPAILI